MATDQQAAVRQAVAERLASVREAIACSARAAGRDPDAITLIGVTKFFPAEMALAAIQAGLEDLGENRVQEMLAKQDAPGLSAEVVRWHLIGTLQRNKVRQVIGRTSLIHSVDSLPLLNEIDRRSREAGMVTRVLLQVNITREDTKHGFPADQLPSVLNAAGSFSHIAMCGLMTMAALTDQPDETLPVFRAAKACFDQAASQLGNPADWKILSMGMSQDYRQAIACGATHIRIGSAIFGPRRPEAASV